MSALENSDTLDVDMNIVVGKYTCTLYTLVRLFIIKTQMMNECTIMYPSDMTWRDVKRQLTSATNIVTCTRHTKLCILQMVEYI